MSTGNHFLVFQQGYWRESEFIGQQINSVVADLYEHEARCAREATTPVIYHRLPWHVTTNVAANYCPPLGHAALRIGADGILGGLVENYDSGD